MKKMLLLATMLALMTMMMAAAPAMADDFDGDGFDDGFFFVDCDDFDFDGFCDFDDNNFDFVDFGDGTFQDVEQEAESGEIEQTFDVSSTGDNSNQSVGISGNANTGNVQNSTSITQFGSSADDFDFDDNGASIEFSSDQDLDSNQRVNQSASSGKGGRR